MSKAGQSNLTPGQRHEIATSSKTIQALADEYGIHRNTVLRLRRFKPCISKLVPKELEKSQVIYTAPDGVETIMLKVRKDGLSRE